MTWFRQTSRWRDAEVRSAAVVAGTAVLAVALTWLPARCVPRCLLKSLTGVPCLTCGGWRALLALLAGDVAAALRLQPLLTLLAGAAAVWVGYAVAGPLFGLPRLRACATRREKRLLLAGALALALANWVYLAACRD